jgi:hypothetical protein
MMFNEAMAITVITPVMAAMAVMATTVKPPRKRRWLYSQDDSEAGPGSIVSVPPSEKPRA